MTRNSSETRQVGIVFCDYQIILTSLCQANNSIDRISCSHNMQLTCVAKTFANNVCQFAVVVDVFHLRRRRAVSQSLWPIKFLYNSESMARCTNNARTHAHGNSHGIRHRLSQSQGVFVSTCGTEKINTVIIQSLLNYTGNLTPRSDLHKTHLENNKKRIHYSRTVC